MKIKLILGTAAVMLATTLAANAQSTPVINYREHKQVHRINNGVRSGQLTRSEATRLRNREQSIRTEKRMAKATGTMTPAERTRLQHRETRTSNAIYRKKHNSRSY